MSPQVTFDQLVEGVGVSSALVWCIDLALATTDQGVLDGIRLKAQRIGERFSARLSSFEKQAVDALLYKFPDPIHRSCWGVLGDLFNNHQIGTHLSPEVCDQTAGQCYERAGDYPNAEASLAGLLVEGRYKKNVSQQLRDEEAAVYLRRSKFPITKDHLGRLLAEGRIKPHKKDAEDLMESGSPIVLAHAGNLLMGDTLGTDLPPKARYEKGAKCLRISNLPEGLSNLGICYMRNRTGQYLKPSLGERCTEAIKLFEQSDLPSTWFNIGVVCAYLGDTAMIEQCFHIAALKGHRTASFLESCNTARDLGQRMKVKLAAAPANKDTEGSAENNSSPERLKNSSEAPPTSAIAQPERTVASQEGKNNGVDVLESKNKRVKVLDDEKPSASAGANDANKEDTNPANQSSRLLREERERRKEELRQAQLAEKYSRWLQQGKKPESADVEEFLDLAQSQTGPLIKREIVFLEKDAPPRGTSIDGLRAWAKSRGPKAVKALELSEELLNTNFVSRRGKPEKLLEPRYRDKNCWSMRVDRKNRLIWSLEEDTFVIHAFDEGHYED